MRSKEKYIEEDPMFVVANDRTRQDVRSELYDKQRETMKYFINLGGQSIATNSAAVASMLKIDRLDGEGDRHVGRYRKDPD